MSDAIPVERKKRQRSHEVHRRESVVFYRGFGSYSPLGRCWHLQIHGSIFAPSKRIIRKTALIHLLKRVVKPEKTTEVRQRFLDRARLFLNESRKGKSVPIAIARQPFALPVSAANGHFQATITIPEAELASSIQQDQYGRRFVQFCTHLPDEDDRLFPGEIELISEEGVSVVSDVDDTIKVSNVADKRELLANTFTREFRSVPGMRDLYQSWAERGYSFHYVSASPWPLYKPLVDWLDADEFPIGSIHLRHIALRELRTDKKREKSFQDKKAAIEKLLRAFPRRRFILCGDSGERDAELYREIALTFGEQIEQICIRETEHSGNGHLQSIEKILDGVGSHRWKLFRLPQELVSV